MDATIDSLKDNSTTRCILFRSLVPNVFCAGKECLHVDIDGFCSFTIGADLKERLAMPQEEVGPFVSKIKEIFSKIFALPVPTIVALDGE